MDLVKWKGRSIEEATWEDYRSLVARFLAFDLETRSLFDGIGNVSNMDISLSTMYQSHIPMTISATKAMEITKKLVSDQSIDDQKAHYRDHFTSSSAEDAVPAEFQCISSNTLVQSLVNATHASPATMANRTGLEDDQEGKVASLVIYNDTPTDRNKCARAQVRMMRACTFSKFKQLFCSQILGSKDCLKAQIFVDFRSL